MDTTQLRSLALAALVVLSVVAVGGVASAAGNTEVSLSPSSQTVGVGDTVTYEVVVENASDGVDGYEFNVSVSDTATATVTDVSLRGEPSNEDVTFASDNSSVSVTGALLNDSLNNAQGSVVVAEVTVTGQAIGRADVNLSVRDVSDPNGFSYTVTGTNNATVAVGGTDVSVSPSSQSVAAGSTTTYDIVVESASNGVDSYDVNLSTSNVSAASITDVTLLGEPDSGTQTVEFASDNSSVHVVAALLNDTYNNAEGSVTIVRVTVKGENAGSADLSLTVNEVGDSAGNSYLIEQVNNASVTVTESEAGPGDVTGNGLAAKDWDGDGNYEDVDGDGDVDFTDVLELAFLEGADPAFFDFDGDGDYDFDDVITLAFSF